MTENQPEDLIKALFLNADGVESILTLLDLIPDPAIIYAPKTGQILAANNALYLLTSLEENDFLLKDIRALLPNITDLSPITGHGQKTRLRHKKQPLIQVTVRLFPLSENSENLLILLHPEGIDPPEPISTAPQQNFIDQLQYMVSARGQKDISTALGQVLEIAKELLSANVVCLYKASGTVPQLRQYQTTDAALASLLPNPLTSEDLVDSQDSVLWTEGLPIRNTLQKTAASANFKTLIAVPLGQDSAKFGLFVAAKRSAENDEIILPMAKMIATYTAGLMEDQIALHNTRSLSYKIKQVVKIQNEIIKNLEEGILILTPDLTIAEINPAAEDMLGYATVEALRQHVDSILIGSESFGSAFSSAREGYPTLISGELMLHHRDGKSFPAQVMTTPVMNNGNLVSIVILIRDNSQAEESQAEKKQLEQRAILGEVTAIFAHEVRNPLNAITLALQVIEENLSPDDENMIWVQKIQEECKNLIQLMESVLSFAKPLEYKMVDVNLQEIIQHLLERWRPRLLRLNITSYFESDIAKPITRGDLRALEQVFTNLISNAAQAMSEDGGYLGIKIMAPTQGESQSQYQINITDSGPGIPADIRSQMFKPFVTGSKHGTGLGLAITQRIINAHKGKIEVDSFPGGTIFKVFLSKKKEGSGL